MHDRGAGAGSLASGHSHRACKRRLVSLWRDVASLGLLLLVPATASPAAAVEIPSPPQPSAGADPIVDEEAAAPLRRGIDLYQQGKYAEALIEFESVLPLDDLPLTPHQQAEVYAEAARAELSGQSWQLSGYALLGGGNYAENDTEAGAAELDTMFFSARVGGRASHQISAANRLNLSLDYRFRHYDYTDRRDYHDLRWNAKVGHNGAGANVTIGLRGRASYLGDGKIRNDYGIFTQIRWQVGPNDQLRFGAELRRRDYPKGPLRQRSRNIVELDGQWSRAIFGGKASLDLDIAGGMEKATEGRIDGDSLFVKASSTFSYSITDNLGGYVMLWWQNDAYSLERFDSGPGGEQVFVNSIRNDDLVEVGGGFTWEFGQDWSVNPSVLWVRDYSNLIAVNYSSTEVHVTLRKDF